MPPTAYSKSGEVSKGCSIESAQAILYLVEKTKVMEDTLRLQEEKTSKKCCSFVALSKGASIRHYYKM